VGARGRAGGESPPERPAVARGEGEVGRPAAFAACRRVATRLPGASPTGMGFSGRVRPCGRCRGSLAVHRGGPPCPSMRGREATGLAGCSPTRSLHHTRTGDFEDLTCRGELGTCIPNHLACRLRRLLSRATSSSGPPFASSSTSRWMSRRRWPRSPGVVQRLPLHRFSCRSPRVVDTPPRSRAAGSPYGAGVAVALARRPPWVPTSSSGYDLAGFFLLQTAGVLHPAPILGFGPFHLAAALAPATLPAPRSRPPKPCSPREATRPAHARRAAARHAIPVAGSRFTEPLTASSFAVAGGDLAVLLLPRSGTTRAALPRSGAPMLPWAWTSSPPRCRVGSRSGTSKNVRENALSVAAPGSPVARGRLPVHGPL
jgi:hypothetical protein